MLSSRSSELCPQITCDRLASCSFNDTPGHHLVCRATGRIRTTRHHSCVAILLNRLDKISRDAKKEVVVGPLRNGRMDIVATIGDDLWNIDVGIVTVRELGPNFRGPLWEPQHSEVMANLALQKEKIRRGTFEDSLFFWETDRQKEERHPLVEFAIMKHHMMRTRHIGGVIGQMCATKKLHYANLRVEPPVSPFIITPNGGVGPEARSIITSIVAAYPSEQLGAMAYFARELKARLSITLVRYACAMLHTSKGIENDDDGPASEVEFLQMLRSGR